MNNTPKTQTRGFTPTPIITTLPKGQLKAYRNERCRGFTILELLVTVAIIALLTAIVLVSLTEVRERSRIAAAQEELKQLRMAVTLLEATANEWPGHKISGVIDNGGSNDETWDLNAPEAGLVRTDGSFSNWNGPYIPSAGPDPWGNNYFFDTDYDIDPTSGRRWAVVIGSFGPNGVGQNLYDSDDIIEVIMSE